ncbi:DUF4352 domain-containing protein [Bacillus cereus group sp. MYBK58-1]|uniref:DUF4352 domain-containing protein n=1 Tax=Bacillus cereus group sp. MYBK58-1 TaxID=3450618 RepID=UPI003F7A6F21
MFEKLGIIALGSALAFSLAACDDSSNKAAIDTKDESKQEEKNDIQTDSTKSEETSKDSEPTQNSSDKVYQLNESIKVKETEITLTKVEEKNTVGIGDMKEEAYSSTFVEIQYNLKNITDKPTGTGFIGIRLMDDKGTKYDADQEANELYAAETNIYKVDSDINPGNHVTKTKVFRIDKEKYNTGKWYVTIGTKYKIQIK